MQSCHGRQQSCRYSVAGFAALRALTPDFGTLSSRAMALEADFRKAHHYLKQHAESVAFFGGAGREATAISGHLEALLQQHRTVARARWLHAIVDDLFTKQLPHNATWALTLLYALQRPESAWADAEAQVRSLVGAETVPLREFHCTVPECHECEAAAVTGVLQAPASRPLRSLCTDWCRLCRLVPSAAFLLLLPAFKAGVPGDSTSAVLLLCCGRAANVPCSTGKEERVSTPATALHCCAVAIAHMSSALLGVLHHPCCN